MNISQIEYSSVDTFGVLSTECVEIHFMSMYKKTNSMALWGAQTYYLKAA